MYTKMVLKNRENILNVCVEVFNVVYISNDGFVDIITENYS